MNRARSDLALGKIRSKDVLLEDLCFHAQQAAEKAIKAVLVQHQVEFPYVHDLGQLLPLVEQAGVRLPRDIRAATSLTRFAVLARYPGLRPPPTEEEYHEAIRLAEAVVKWAVNLIRATHGEYHG